MSEQNVNFSEQYCQAVRLSKFTCRNKLTFTSSSSISLPSVFDTDDVKNTGKYILFPNWNG